MSAEEVLSITSILDKIKDTFTKPMKVLEEYLEYSFSKLYDLTTESDAYNSKPNLIFTNPLTRDIFLSEISIIFDKDFMEKGQLIINLDSTRIFELGENSTFSKTGILQLDYSKKKRILKPKKEITFHIWNGTDKTEIKASVLISVGR